MSRHEKSRYEKSQWNKRGRTNESAKAQGLADAGEKCPKVMPRPSFPVNLSQSHRPMMRMRQDIIPDLIFPPVDDRHKWNKKIMHRPSNNRRDDIAPGKPSEKQCQRGLHSK